MKNVSCFSVIFAMGLGEFSEREIANIGLGAFLHDIGLSRIDSNVADKNPTRMNKVELADYHQHPSLGVELIKEFDLDLPHTVTDIVMAHHEQYDGRGFHEDGRVSRPHLPRACHGLQGSKVCPGALSPLRG